MKKQIEVTSIFLFAILFFFSSCSTTRYVVPIKKGEQRITANLGGPLIHYSGIIIPVPLTALGYAYGVNDHLTAFGNFHTTALAFGVFELDAGVLQNVIQQKKWQPGISVNGVANLMLDKWKTEFRFYPEVDVNAYWHYRNKQSFAYAGISNWIELQNTGANDRKQTTHLLPSFYAGHTFSRTKMDYSLEAKWIAPFSSNKNIVVDYVGAGSLGTLGIYFSLSKKF